MKKTSHPLIKSALLLTVAGLTTRVIGFFYKIFLVSLIGAEGIGIYQMVFPLYMLCVSLVSSGIQTAISRFTAERQSTDGPARARSLFLTGLSMALGLSVAAASILYLLAEPLSLYYLGESRCLPLLQVMALAIPFEAVHGCVNAYFIGRKKAGFPALSQFLEQLIRVLATVIIFQAVTGRQQEPSPLLAAQGMLAAEFFVALLSLALLLFRRGHSGSHAAKKESGNDSALSSRPSLWRENSRLILRMALPLTGNRLMLNVLQSAEAAMIPTRLELYYKNTSAALSTYGIFTGMAMPLIMFPCAITGSFSTVLLPSVSEAHALGDERKIAKTIRSSLMFCAFLGIVSTWAFLCFGSSLGQLLYGQELVGSYLSTLAWICPFLYLTTTVSSILHGLGKTSSVFAHNLIGLLIRLAFTWFFVPAFGIQGCLWGLLASQLVTALLGIAALSRAVPVSFSPIAGILAPAALCGASTILLKLLQTLLPVLAIDGSWISFLLSAGIWGCLMLITSLPVIRRLGQEAG